MTLKPALYSRNELSVLNMYLLHNVEESLVGKLPVLAEGNVPSGNISEVNKETVNTRIPEI